MRSRTRRASGGLRGPCLSRISGRDASIAHKSLIPMTPSLSERGSLSRPLRQRSHPLCRDFVDRRVRLWPGGLCQKASQNVAVCRAYRRCVRFVSACFIDRQHQKCPFPGTSCKLSDGAVDPLLTMRLWGQPAAAGGKEIRLVEAVSGLETLEPFAPLAPSFFHNLSIFPASARCAVCRSGDGRRRKSATAFAVDPLSNRTGHHPTTSLTRRSGFEQS